LKVLDFRKPLFPGEWFLTREADQWWICQKSEREVEDYEILTNNRNSEKVKGVISSRYRLWQTEPMDKRLGISMCSLVCFHIPWVDWHLLCIYGSPQKQHDLPYQSEDTERLTPQHSVWAQGGTVTAGVSSHLPHKTDSLSLSLSLSLCVCVLVGSWKEGQQLMGHGHGQICTSDGQPEDLVLRLVFPISISLQHGTLRQQPLHLSGHIADNPI
jgi:hypothetical protein